MNSRLLASAVFFSLFTLHPEGFSQQVAQPSQLETTATTAVTAVPIVTTTTGTAAANDEIVQMSVFNVTGERDQGYTAFATTAGARVRTDLRDTSASISPFTEEFLSDIGATTIDDIMAYAGNAELEMEDSGNGFNNLGSRGAGNTDTRFRIRGMGMDVALDNVTTSFPIDNYNIERTEISSGANSILFGAGSGGGMVTLTSKRANLQRNALRVQNTLGTWNNLGEAWNFYRATLDYNVVLMPRKLAFRLNALYQDGGNQSWRYWMMLRDKRINPAVTIKPWQNTTINISYETGRRRDSTSYAWNPGDQLTAWLAWRAANPATKGIMTGFGSTVAVPTVPYPYNPSIQLPAVRWKNDSGVPYYVFVDNDGILQDDRQGFISVNYWENGSGANTPNNTNIRPDANIASYNYNPVGPGGHRDQKFDRYQMVIDQTIGGLNLELGYYHNKNNVTAQAAQENDISLQADPNPVVYTAEYNGGSGAGTIPNPHAGQLYMQDFWQKNSSVTTNDALRLTAEYTLNLKKYGRHRLIGVLEHTETDQRSTPRRQILVDQFQQAAYNVNEPSDTNNLINHRNYATEGDFTTYYAGNADTPVPDTIIGNNIYHAQWVALNNVANNGYPTHTQRNANSYMAVLQSYLFSDRLVTTFGGRIDDTSVRQENRARIKDPNDPRILSRANVLNEIALNGIWGGTRRKAPFTYSAGAVWHATDRFSLFYNYSTNRSAPNLGGNTVLPDGNPMPITAGRSRDYGVMFDVLGDNKIYLRLTHFDSHQTNATGVFNNADIGGNNLENIFDAMYFLTTTDRTHDVPMGGWLPGTGVKPGTNIGLGPMTPAQFAVRAPDSSYPFGAPPLYNTALTSVYARGYELEITGNFTKNFTMRLTMSYQDRQRIDLFSEIFDYYNKNIPVWMALADPNNNGGHGPDGTGNAFTVVFPSTLTNTAGQTSMSLYDFIRNQLYAPSGSTIGGGKSVRYGLINQLIQQSGPMANRPLKFNLTARYRFQQGWLKGLSVGGGARYQDAPLIPNPFVVPANPDMPPVGTTNLAMNPDDYNGSKGMDRGTALLFWDGFLTYKRKLLGGRTTMTLQLNVQNIFNQYLVTEGRYTSQGLLRRVYLSTPRTIRLTATFDF